MPYLLGNKAVDWCYESEPEPFADNRVTPVPRGKVLGGSSSINAMCYIRGHARDYDIWRQLGNVGWSWDDVLPYFKSIEKYPRGADDAHGADGELGVQENRIRWEVVEAWKQAALDYGIPPNDDHNRGDNEGVGYFQGTISKGRRSSAAQAFLHPVMHRPNLHVLINAHVKRLRFQGQARGRRRVLEGERASARGSNRRNHPRRGCDRLAADPAALRHRPAPLCCKQHGIAVLHELPGVGENMQDHWQIRCTYKVKNTVTLNQWVNNPLRRYAMGAYYLATRRGPMSVQPPQLCAFTRSDPSQDTPNLHYHVSPISSDRFGGPLHKWPGLSCGIAVVRPQSIGYVRIKSADPHAHPAILHNFLATPEARRVAVDAIRMTRKIVHSRRTCALRAGGDRAGRRLRDRRRDSCLCAPDGDHRVPPVRQLQDGPRPAGGGGRSAARARTRRPARDRRLDHAERDFRQHQRAVDDDRREGCRDDPAGSPGRGGGSVSYFRFSNSNIA